MALGRTERERQGELWVATDQIARGAGPAFYDRLDQLLREAGFDRFVEDLCEPYCKEGDCLGIAPGVLGPLLPTERVCDSR